MKIVPLMTIMLTMPMIINENENENEILIEIRICASPSFLADYFSLIENIPFEPRNRLRTNSFY